MEELLQKHRSFTLAVAVGGFVFILAILLRGCAVYSRDLGAARTAVEKKAKDLQDPKNPVPDEKYLKDLDRVVEAADARVAELANEVGRTNGGERLWEDCVGDVLAVIHKDTPEKRKDLMERARRLPSAAFSLLLEEVRTEFSQRAAQNDVEIAPQELGFEQVREADFGRYVAALAAIVRVVDRAITAGVSKVETIAVSNAAAAGGEETASFMQSILVRFRFRGPPPALAELLKTLNDRDREGRGRRLVLDEVQALGRPENVRAGEPGMTEFTVRVFLVNLEAKEEAAQ